MTSATAFLEGFLIAKKSEHCSPKTIEHYQYHLKTFLKYVDGTKGISDVTTTDIRLFLLSREKAVSRNTIHGDFRCVRTFFNWLEDEELIFSNPVKKVKAPHVSRPVIATFSPEQISDLLELCTPRTFLGSRNRAIVLILLDTGLRLNELASIRISDVKENMITVWGKGAKQRRVRIGATTQKALWRYMLYHHRESEYLWLTEEGLPMQSKGISIMVRRLGRRAGFSGVRCSPHTFRHTFAINFLRNGGDIFTLQYLLGHSSLEMVRRYLGALNAEDAANAHSRYSPVDNMRLR